MNYKTVLKNAAVGAIQGNLPELLGAIGTWYTFKDKKYALELSMDQVQAQAVTNSVVGALTPVALMIMNPPKNNNNYHPRHGKKKNKGHK